MALKSYVLTEDFKSPYVRMTGHPKNPQQIRFKLFKKGEVVDGELKHANNKPAFVLYKGTLVLPLSHIKELTTKEIVEPGSPADGVTSKETKKLSQSPVAKLKIGEMAVFGALIGVFGVYVAQKQNWIAPAPEGDKKNFIYGAVAGAVLGGYIYYKMKK